MCFLACVVPQKRCHKCKIPQSWESFSKDKYSPDGMSPLCSTCNSLKQKALYQKHHIKKAADARARRLIEGDKLRAQARVRYGKDVNIFLLKSVRKDNVSPKNTGTCQNAISQASNKNSAI